MAFCFFRYTMAMAQNSYQNNMVAQNYMAFLDSPNGQIQQEILFRAIWSRIQKAKSKQVLDAGCGTGWLTHMLSSNGFTTVGCDSSLDLLEYARRAYPNETFNQADLTKPLSYPSNYFDGIIVNMASQDVEFLDKMFLELGKILHTGGKLIITIPNPFYTFPKGVWKRGIISKLTGGKPTLRLFPHGYETPDNKKPTAGFFRQLEDYINLAVDNNFALTHFEEIKSVIDSKKFDLRYQMFRYPLILLIEWQKNL